MIRFLFNFLNSNNNNWYKIIEKKISYNFKNKNLLKTAITHKSVSSNPSENYERLELIGDSVINLIITEWLSKKYTNFTEGDLTTKRASLVNTHFLSKISNKLKLEENIIISKGVNLNNDVVLKNISADIFESITGAIYLDSNILNAKNFILKTLIENYNLSNKNDNYKGLLIEYCHKKYQKPPVFKIISSEGPDHDKLFKVKAYLKNIFEYQGLGKSIKDAEQNAAKQALVFLKKL